MIIDFFLSFSFIYTGIYWCPSFCHTLSVVYSWYYDSMSRVQRHRGTMKPDQSIHRAWLTPTNSFNRPGCWGPILSRNHHGLRCQRLWRVVFLRCRSASSSLSTPKHALTFDLRHIGRSSHNKRPGCYLIEIVYGSKTMIVTYHDHIALYCSSVISLPRCQIRLSDCIICDVAECLCVHNNIRVSILNRRALSDSSISESKLWDCEEKFANFLQLCQYSQVGQCFLYDVP